MFTCASDGKANVAAVKKNDIPEWQAFYGVHDMHKHTSTQRTSDI